MNRLRPVWAGALLLAVGACGDGPSEPSGVLGIQPAAVPELFPGDEVQLSVPAEAGALSWRSRDPAVADVSGGRVEAYRPGATFVVVSSGGASDSARIVVTPRPGGYSAEEVDYFVEIAPGFEFGNVSEIIRKWDRNIRLHVNGSPSDGDLEALVGVVSEINALTESVDIELVEAEPMVELHFAPTDSFPGILPGWVPGNVGFFSVWWGATQSFTRAVVLISTDVNETLRRHLIREEVTQVLGLGNDSFTYANSVFYQPSSSVTEYAPVDRAVIEILYRPEMTLGLAAADAARVARRLTRRGWTPALMAAADAARQATPDGSPGQGGGGSR